MNINQILNNKGCTVYRLSKETGIPKSTLFDIFSGKTNAFDCSFRIIVKLCNALDIKINDFIKLTPVPYNKSYEEMIPDFLRNSIQNLKHNKNKLITDCLLDEVNSSINVSEVENLISKDQADYLRNKYLE